MSVGDCNNNQYRYQESDDIGCIGGYFVAKLFCVAVASCLSLT